MSKQQKFQGQNQQDGSHCLDRKLGFNSGINTFYPQEKVIARKRWDLWWFDMFSNSLREGEKVDQLYILTKPVLEFSIKSFKLFDGFLKECCSPKSLVLQSIAEPGRTIMCVKTHARGLLCIKRSIQNSQAPNMMKFQEYFT